MREGWDTMNIKNEMTVENFNYSNVEKYKKLGVL